MRASSRWKNYRPRRSKVFSSFKTKNHLLFPVTHTCIGSPFGISLQATTRFPDHFYQPTRLKVKIFSDASVEQLKIRFSFQNAQYINLAKPKSGAPKE